MAGKQSPVAREMFSYLDENYKERSEKEIIAGLKAMPQCNAPDECIPKAFYHPPPQRDELLVEGLIKEIADLRGWTPEDVLEIHEEYHGKIMEKTSKGWKILEPDWEEDEEEEGDDQVLTDWDYSSIIWEFKRQRDGLKKENKTNIPEDVRLKSHLFKLSESGTTGLKVSNGWLIGTDSGEFGGGLAYVGDDGKTNVLHEKNILGVYNTPFGVVAVCGMAHMITDFGYILPLARKKGKWIVGKKIDLYSRPYIMEQKEDGSVVIGNRYGSFLINEKGLCRIATIEL